MLKIIGITGYARAGKNLSSTYLKNILYNLELYKHIQKDISISTTLIPKWEEYSFAYPIKRMVWNELIPNKFKFSYDLETIKDVEVFPGITGRLLYQKIGTEVGRNIYSNIWVDLCLEKIDVDNNNAIITDVRFPNEVEAIKRLGGIIIKKLGKGNEVVMEHESEQYIKDIKADYTIPWFDNKEDLKTYIKHLAYDIKY